MVLVFKNNKGKRKVVGYPKNNSEAFEMMNDYCSKNNLKVKYYRVCARDQGNGKIVTTFDFGNHTEFFYMADEQYEKELLQK